MAMQDNATRFVTYVDFLIGKTNDARLTDADAAAWYADGTIPAAFDVVGHTDPEQVAAFDREGGETEVIGSFQNRALEQISTEEAIEKIAVASLQVADPAILALYFGGGERVTETDATSPTGTRFRTPLQGIPTQRPFAMLMRSARGGLGLEAPKASWLGGDAIEMPNDNFVKVPLSVTFLGAFAAGRYHWLLPDAFGTGA